MDDIISFIEYNVNDSFPHYIIFCINVPFFFLKKKNFFSYKLRINFSNI